MGEFDLWSKRQRPDLDSELDHAMATILFLHGWQSVPGGVKPTYLKDHGHIVINPKLPDDDFAEAVRIAQAEFDKHRPEVVVGSSRGGAVAMNINSTEARLVLLCPAWRKYGTAKTVKRGTIILHSRADEVIPFADSLELGWSSGLPASTLVEVGTDHRLADPRPLAAMLKACDVPESGSVRRIWLVGESLPLAKVDKEKNAVETGLLTDRLVCLDPRHGVFPNLVMKPLFAATLAAFGENHSEAIALLQAFEDVVCDRPDRRFNLFEPKVTDQRTLQGNRFVFDQTDTRIEMFDSARDIWLVFGHQTVSGLLRWLLKGGDETTRKDLRDFLIKVTDTISAVARLSVCSSGFHIEPPTSKTGRVGLIHRLCTAADDNGSGATNVLHSLVRTLNTGDRYTNEFVVSFIRCIVPLMHNEAYNDGRHAVGNAQRHFVRSATNNENNRDLYWQVMGHAIARRCFNRWVE